MIGAADADHAFFLSPSRWKAEADEHDPSDVAATERIVTHELTHSFHGQYNPSPTFDQLDDLAWLVEGVATYVSGQESTEHRGKAKLAATSPQFPAKLESVWTGNNRYAIAGSLVKFVDVTYGRRTLFTLLAATSNKCALAILKTSEAKLLGDWKSWLLSGR
jgi:hypothetical protein